MYRLKRPDIPSIEIAGLINGELVGKNIMVNRPSSLKNIQHGSFVCFDKKDMDTFENLPFYEEVLFITDIEKLPVGISYIYTPSPAIVFLEIIKEFFLVNDTITISESAKIHTHAKIGRNVSVGENCVIGPDVVIGDNTQILNNVVITNSVKIGKNCIIKHNSTIGSEGFDFEIDKLGIPVNYPHIGNINIGNNVWIGSNTCIESGKISDTVIGDDVKIDDLVQIGYNCNIGDKSLITSGVIVERDVTIGDRTLVCPNSTKNNIFQLVLIVLWLMEVLSSVTSLIQK